MKENFQSAITFSAPDNYLHLLGTNKFECNVSSTLEIPAPIVHTVGNLVISGESNRGGFCAGATIGSGASASIGDIKVYGGEINILIDKPMDGGKNSS